MVILAQLQKLQHVVLPVGDDNGVATPTSLDVLERVNRLLRGNLTLFDQIVAETPGVKWSNVKTVATDRLEHQS